jgi:hypothetical protein
VKSHEETYQAFVEGRLTKGEWTHEAHLVTCWMALRDRSPSEALAHLRDAITTHNCGIGVANTETSGYHETLTVYYITAIDAVGAETPEALFADARTDRTAPLEYWTKDRLMSTDARAAWLEPDLAPLPWTRVDDAAA